MLNVRKIRKNLSNFFRNRKTFVHTNNIAFVLKKIRNSSADFFQGRVLFHFHACIKLKAVLLILSFANPNVLFSQSQSDFSDPYDFNLRNYKDSPTREVYQEYTIPPVFKKPPLISPKNVQVPFENPFPTTGGGLRRTTNPNTERKQENLINPLTGNINVEAILQRQAQQTDKKKNKIKFMTKRKNIRKARLVVFPSSSL